MSKPDQEAAKPAKPSPAPGQTDANIGNPSRGAQVAAGDKATAPDTLPKKPKGDEKNTTQQ